MVLLFDTVRETLLFIIATVLATWRIIYLFKLRIKMEKDSATDMEVALEMIDKYDFYCDRECWIEGLLFVAVFIASCLMNTYYSCIPIGVAMLVAYWFRNYKLRVDIGPEVINPKYIVKTSVQTASDVIGTVGIGAGIASKNVIGGSAANTMLKSSIRDADDFIDTDRRSATLSEMQEAAEVFGIDVQGYTREELCDVLLLFAPRVLLDSVKEGDKELQTYTLVQMILKMKEKGLMKKG